MIFKMLKRQNGSTSFTLFVIALSVGLVALSVYLVNLPKKGVPKIPANTPQSARINELQGELFQLYTAMDGFESMRNRVKYLEIAGKAGEKLIESDKLWDEQAKGRKGTFNGMIGGVVENYEGRFTAEEKIEMLSKKYGIPEQKLRHLQADLEIMFSAELAEKFAGSDESDQDNAQETENSNSPDNPKANKP